MPCGPASPGKPGGPENPVGPLEPLSPLFPGPGGPGGPLMPLGPTKMNRKVNATSVFYESLEPGMMSGSVKIFVGSRFMHHVRESEV